ncbi:lysoplasmalogenase family protein [Georgenia sp. Z1491]|uniref:lysoplasmalogenase family protein n=1 Tax=Georgenia sp. Z1491 TaxID=3416707 RepID=UPI003CEBE9E0
MTVPAPTGRRRGPSPAAVTTAMVATVVLVVVTLVHLVAQLTGPAILREVTQPLILPPLLLAVLALTPAPRSRTTSWALAALALSWGGDLVPRFLDVGGFEAMLVLFLLAHVCWLIALWPRRRSTPVWSSPALVLPFLGYGVVLVILCAQGAGSLLPAVVAYAAAIIGTALLAPALGTAAAVGALVYIVSDSLLALRTFAGLDLPGHGMWVMATYVAAQVLLAAGVVRVQGRERAGR